jgi:protocatechuate 3,4-dioxygenase beta subunit
VPLALTLTILHQTGAPLANARVDVWQCDKDGVYSGYAQPGANTVGRTFMRGIQVTDASGKVTFKTVYPGWYAGRITHIHFQVYLNNGLVATSQLAFPDDVTKAVYSSALYAAHGQNSSVQSFAQDNVFSDGTAHEMLALTGSVDAGFAATLTAVVAI